MSSVRRGLGESRNIEQGFRLVQCVRFGQKRANLTHIGVPHLGARAGVRKLAGLRVDAEHDHRVAVLVGDKKEAPRRIYGEIARGLA